MKRLPNRSILGGAAILAVVVAIGVLAPVLATSDPTVIDPTARNRKPGAERTVRSDDGRARSARAWMGTDSLGRDVYSRVVYGARVSLIVGVTVALVSALAGRPSCAPAIAKTSDVIRSVRITSTLQN